MAGFFRLSAATSLLDCRSEGGKRDEPKVWRAFHLDYGATRKTARSDVILPYHMYGRMPAHQLAPPYQRSTRPLIASRPPAVVTEICNDLNRKPSK